MAKGKKAWRNGCGGPPRHRNRETKSVTHQKVGCARLEKYMSPCQVYGHLTRERRKGAEDPPDQRNPLMMTQGCPPQLSAFFFWFLSRATNVSLFFVH